MEHQQFPAGHVVSAVTFTNGVVPAYINGLPPGGWSIAVEMAFYLCLPLLHYMVRSLRSAVALAFGVLLLALGMHAVLMSGPVIRWTVENVAGVRNASDWMNGFVYLWLGNQLPVFALGIMAYFVHRRIARQDRGWGVLLLGISIFTMVALVSGGYRMLPPHVMYGIAFVMLVAACSFYPARVIVNGATRTIGTLSFSMYITHFSVRDVVDHVLRGTALAAHPLIYLAVFYCLLLAGTVAVSAATYRMIEVPGMALGRRIIRKLSTILREPVGNARGSDRRRDLPRNIGTGVSPVRNIRCLHESAWRGRRSLEPMPLEIGTLAADAGEAYFGVHW